MDCADQLLCPRPMAATFGLARRIAWDVVVFALAACLPCAALGHLVSSGGLGRRCLGRHQEQSRAVALKQDRERCGHAVEGKMVEGAGQRCKTGSLLAAKSSEGRRGEGALALGSGRSRHSRNESHFADPRTCSPQRPPGNQ
jgi:hypothetical protein